MRRSKVKATVSVGRRKPVNSSQNIKDNTNVSSQSEGAPHQVTSNIINNNFSCDAIETNLESCSKLENHSNSTITLTDISDSSAITPINPDTNISYANSSLSHASIENPVSVISKPSVPQLKSRKTDSNVSLENEKNTNDSRTSLENEKKAIDSSTPLEIEKMPEASQCDLNSTLKSSLNTSIKDNISHLSNPVLSTSPSKICRSKIKAVPILGHRRTYSTSDSEDSHKKITRTESQSSNPSGIQDKSIEQSPTKKSIFNCEMKKKIRKSEGSKKMAEARKEFAKKYTEGKLDHKKLTMMDLIFYNPTTNPMRYEKKKGTTTIGTTKTNENIENVDDPSDGRDDDKSEKDEELNKSDEDDDEIIAPRIKIGPTGEIVLDEKSLVIENKKTKKALDAIENSVAVDGDIDRPYGVYKKFKRSTWTQSDTLKFYRALSSIGTDFALMNELFPKRTRRELKLKFKKEEKINQYLIDQAIMKPCSINFEELKAEFELMEIEENEIQRQKNEKTNNEINKKSSKFLKLTQENSTECIQDDSHSVSGKGVKRKRKKKPEQRKPPKSPKKFDILSALSDTDLESEEESEESFVHSMTQTTRYGRKTKPREISQTNENSEELVVSSKMQRLNSQAECTQKPGSLMVVSSESCDGEPVVQIFMVTDKAEKSAENDKKNLLPIAMIRTQHDDEEIVENNYTIAENVNE